MPVATVPVTHLQQNCSVVWCGETKQAAVIDPGGDLDAVRAILADKGLTASVVLLTHGHVDHAAAAPDLARDLGVEIIGPHEADRMWLDAIPQQCAMFGFSQSPSFLPDRWLSDGETVTVGKLILEVIHCPGHTPGHVVFHAPTENLLIAGDVLFAGSIGRTDFPGSDHAALLDCIRTRLMTLPDAVTVVPGHGPYTTIGRERSHNPFIR